MGLVGAEPVQHDLMARVLDCGGEPLASFQLEKHICIWQFVELAVDIITMRLIVL